MPTTFTQDRTPPNTSLTPRDRPAILYSKLADVSGNYIKDVNNNQIRVRGDDTPFGGTEYTKRTRP